MTLRSWDRRKWQEAQSCYGFDPFSSTLVRGYGRGRRPDTVSKLVVGQVSRLSTETGKMPVPPKLRIRH